MESSPLLQNLRLLENIKKYEQNGTRTPLINGEDAVVTASPRAKAAASHSADVVMGVAHVPLVCRTAAPGRAGGGGELGGSEGGGGCEGGEGGEGG